MEVGWQSPSLQRLPERPFRMVGRPDYSPCSRNARSRTPLVGRALQQTFLFKELSPHKHNPDKTLDHAWVNDVGFVLG